MFGAGKILPRQDSTDGAEMGSRVFAGIKVVVREEMEIVPLY